jgi:hypothetical protein
MPAVHKVNEHLRKTLNVIQDAKGPLGGTASDFAYMASLFHQAFREGFKAESTPLFKDAQREEIVRAEAILERISLDAARTAAMPPKPRVPEVSRPFVPGDVVRLVGSDETLTVGGTSEDGRRVVFIDGKYADVGDLELSQPADEEKQRAVIKEMLELPGNQARHSWAKVALERLDAQVNQEEAKPEGGQRRRKTA